MGAVCESGDSTSATHFTYDFGQLSGLTVLIYGETWAKPKVSFTCNIPEPKPSVFMDKRISDSTGKKQELLSVTEGPWWPL
jgi:hypothetical protein